MSYSYVKPRTKLEKRVLAYCNEVRKKFGLRPRKVLRKGVPHHGEKCVVALTIGLSDPFRCYVLCGKVNVGKRIVPSIFEDVVLNEYLPRYVRQFTIKFDRQLSKRYRELRLLA